VNDRVRQLAEQAGFDWALKRSSLYGQDNDKQNLAKFAQLIVKECSKVIVNGGYRNPALGEKHPLTPLEIATMIKEHFGVEK